MRRTPSGEESQLCGAARDVNAIPAIELAQDAVDVHLGGARAEAQGRGDLAAAQTAGDESRHLELARREAASAHSGGGKTPEPLFNFLSELGDLLSDPVR